MEPKKLVKITDAAKRARLPNGKPPTRQTVRNWAISKKIYSQDSTEVLGLILVDPEEVIAYAANPLGPGRPKGTRDHPTVKGKITPDLSDQFIAAKKAEGDSDDEGLAAAVQLYVDKSNRRRKKK